MFFKKKPLLKRESIEASHLLKRLLSLHIVKIFLLLVIIIILMPLIAFFIMRPKAQPNLNYGITFSKKYATTLGLDWRDTYIKILDDLKVRNLRLVAYWDEIETQQDSYDFTDVIWQLEEAQKRGANVIMVIGRKVPRFPECFEPTWWRKIDREDLRDIELLEYLKKAVAALGRYKAVKMWQVENEPFFPFGNCMEIKQGTVSREVALVKTLDNRPVLIQDSGEGGFWFPSYKLGDYLAISMYRKIWYDFWKVLFGQFVYFQYPLAHWTYKIKADIMRVPYEKIIVTELQAEPWGPDVNSALTTTEKNKTMSPQDFIATISYAQKTGFKDFYFWGVEWWLWEKEKNNEAFYWDTAKPLFALPH